MCMRPFRYNVLRTGLRPTEQALFREQFDVVVGALQRGGQDVTWLSHNARDFVHVAYGLVVRGLSRKVEIIADSNASIDTVIASWLKDTSVLPAFGGAKGALRMSKLDHEFQTRMIQYETV